MDIGVGGERGATLKIEFFGNIAWHGMVGGRSGRRAGVHFSISDQRLEIVRQTELKVSALKKLWEWDADGILLYRWFIIQTPRGSQRAISA